MNRHLATVVISPMTTASRDYPTRVPLEFGGRQGWGALDRFRTVDARRLRRRLGRIGNNTAVKVKSVIREMLVD